MKTKTLPFYILGIGILGYIYYNHPKKTSHITAIDMTSATDCLDPCNLIVGVTWNNNGNKTGTFIPSIIIDNNKIISLPPENLDPDSSITLQFYLEDIEIGIHDICPNPN